MHKCIKLTLQLSARTSATQVKSHPFKCLTQVFDQSMQLAMNSSFRSDSGFAYPAIAAPSPRRGYYLCLASR